MDFKPADRTETVRKSLPQNQNPENCVTLKALCRALSISDATGRNWLRLGRLTPTYTENGVPYFSREDILSIKEALRSDSSRTLKKRRNKTCISGSALYHDYVSESSENLPLVRQLLNTAKLAGIDFDLPAIRCLIADCALHLFADQAHPSHAPGPFLLYRFLCHEIPPAPHHPLIEALIDNKERALAFCREHPLLFCRNYTYTPHEDLLGLIYLSCQNLGQRKAAGAYYTPTAIVEKLISSLSPDSSHQILDPCCGTGNFLLQLPDNIPFRHIYGSDLDVTGVTIARINMALKFPEETVDSVSSHITLRNFLTEGAQKPMTHIMGNPPWGYQFSEEEKAYLKKTYACAAGRHIESYDVFIEKSLRELAPGGQMAYILPEALLGARSHLAVRKLLFESCAITYLAFLGEAFPGVQCPCILLQVKRTGKEMSATGTVVNDGLQTFKIRRQRPLTPERFHFMITDEDYRLLEKIRSLPENRYLAGHGDFALGIVTGNNKACLSSEKTDRNEPVLSGSDICPYRVLPARQFITYQPELFQQTAPEAMYRAPEKLLYRFISRRLVFAYDDQQTLSLNSCNIVIPRLQDLHIKYVLALLNSRAAQFVYQKEYHSVKVLRSHIEGIPIPAIPWVDQLPVIEKVDLLLSDPQSPRVCQIYEALDAMISAIFHLSKEEQQRLFPRRFCKY